MRARALENLGPNLFHGTVVNHIRRLPSEDIEHRSCGRADVLAGGLRDLNVHVDAAVETTPVQFVPQCPEQGCLARLARGVQDKIPFLLNQALYFIQVNAGQRRNMVVAIRVDWPGCVKEAHGTGHCSDAGRRYEPGLPAGWAASLA